MRFRIAALITLMILATSCAGGKSPADAIVVAIESSPTTFDPRLAMDSYSMKIDELIFNGLVKLDKNFDYTPDLAQKYEQLNDVTYRFFLRENVRFHNGDLLTADDVIYTFRTIMSEEMASPFKATFDYIKDIEKESDNVITIRLKEPYAPFLTAMVKGIVPKNYAEKMGKEFGQLPVGTGPYKLTEFISDSHVNLEVNEDYFGEKPKLPRLIFKIFKDDNVRVLQLMRGSVDMVQNAVPPVLLKMLEKRKNLSVDAAPSIVFAYLGMNLEDKILSNENVRRALAHSINREEIIKYKWEGFARIANTLLAPSHWAYTADVSVYDFDPEKAKRLLDEAGYPDPDGDGPKKRFYLSYKTSTQKHRIDIANLIAEQLSMVGIGVNVTPYEWGTFFRDIKTGDFQLYSLTWVGITEPDIYYSIYNSTQMPPSGANRNRYVNKEIDRLTELGRATVDKKRRAEIYKKVQQIVADELPYIPLWYEDNVVVRGSDLLNYQITADAGFDGFVDAVKE